MDVVQMATSSSQQSINNTATSLNMGTTNGVHQVNGSAKAPLRIAIVGGGIGGLALALGLANRQREGANITFQIFEAAPQFKEIGAGVGVGPNAFRALNLLGLREPYSKLAFTHDEDESGIYFIWRWGEKDRVAQNGGDDVIATTPCFEKGGHTTVHRAEFLDMMIERIPQGVAQFNKRLVSYETTPEGSKDVPVRLHFADETSFDADVLVAADGIKSVVRPTMLAGHVDASSLKPQFTRTVAYRTLVPMEEMVAKIGEKARKGTMYLGKDHHILTFPIQGGKTMNVVAFISDRTPSSKSAEWPSESWIVEGSREEMMSGWENWSEDCQQILQAIKQPSKWALHELADFPTHAVGNVCLMGDSAAATLPHQGQGAAQAIESAYTLSSLLASPLLTRSNVHEALQVYNELRHARTTGVKTTSNELGRVLEFSDGQIDGDKEGLVKNLQSRYEWMWGWDGEAEVAKGMQVLEQRLS